MRSSDQVYYAKSPDPYTHSGTMTVDEIDEARGSYPSKCREIYRDPHDLFKLCRLLRENAPKTAMWKSLDINPTSLYCHHCVGRWSVAIHTEIATFGSRLHKRLLAPNILRPRQNDHHFVDDISKCIFLCETCCIFIPVSLQFVPIALISNKTGLVQKMSTSHYD